MIFLFSIWCAFCCVAANEVTARQGLGILRWIKSDFYYFLLNLILFISPPLLFYGAAGFLFVPCLCFALISAALANVSHFKRAARNEPLYASDLLLFFKVASVSDKSNIHITRYNAASLLIYAAGLAPTFFLAPEKRGLTPIIFITSIIIIACVILFIAFDGTDDFIYSMKGLLFGFVSNVYLYFKKPEAPPGEKITRDYFFSVKETSAEPALKPTVIMLLSESFWDATKLPGLEFSREPLPNFKKLRETCASGNLIVTPFGGGTCNVESEILTGVPARYFNQTKSFFHGCATCPLPSLARVFRENGYEARGLHTFDKNFYGRDKAFEMFGFESFKGKENLINPGYDGSYISDGELTKMIIETFEAKKKPAFIFAVSMQNHQPYGKNKYDHRPVELLNSDLSENLRHVAEAYAHGLYDADRELAALVGYFSNSNEPVDILFFGDHLAALGPAFGLYRRTGFISNNAELSTEEIRKLYSTEFILWSNYKNDKKHYPDTSSNFLGNILLNHSGISKPEFYYFLDEIYSEWTCVNRGDLFVDSKGNAFGFAPDGFMRIEAEYGRVAKEMVLSSRKGF